jgi:L-amino acid N-acyltransferase YncA
VFIRTTSQQIAWPPAHPAMEAFGDVADEPAAIVIRGLTATDVPAFRAIALEAFDRDGRNFAIDRIAELARTDSDWAESCRETPQRAVFGGFVAGRLVGIMAARAWYGDAAGRAVLWGSAYVRPALRRTGVGMYLYGTREQWSKQRGFGAAVFAIRADNARSTEIHLANGARRIGGEVMRYADGSRAPTCWYRKEL